MIKKQEKSQMVLVVDDDISIRLMVCEYLRDLGFSIAEAGDGQTALEVFDSVQPKAVLMDASMPIMDGFDACRALRQRAGGEHVPVMIITGLDDGEAIHRAYEAGATDFATKPFNIVMLGYRLRYMLRASQALQDLKSSQMVIRQQEKMASIDQLSAGVAHEINNPIGFIRSNLSSLRKYFSKLLMLYRNPR